MIFKIAITLLMTFLTIYAFWSNAEGGRLFTPFGILFLILTILIWLGWRPICDAFRSAKAEAELPILPMVRLGAAMVDGMSRPPAHRHDDEHPESGS